LLFELLPVLNPASRSEVRFIMLTGDPKKYPVYRDFYSFLEQHKRY
jgi:hypothetical protein